jgi:hypothetical protein
MPAMTVERLVRPEGGLNSHAGEKYGNRPAQRTCSE